MEFSALTVILAHIEAAVIDHCPVLVIKLAVSAVNTVFKVSFIPQISVFAVKLAFSAVYTVFKFSVIPQISVFAVKLAASAVNPICKAAAVFNYSVFIQRSRAVVLTVLDTARIYRLIVFFDNNRSGHDVSVFIERAASRDISVFIIESALAGVFAVLETAIIYERAIFVQRACTVVLTVSKRSFVHLAARCRIVKRTRAVILAVLDLAVIQKFAIVSLYLSRTVLNVAVLIHFTAGDDISTFIIKCALSLHLAVREFAVIDKLSVFIELSGAVILSLGELTVIFKDSILIFKSAAVIQTVIKLSVIYEIAVLVQFSLSAVNSVLELSVIDELACFLVVELTLAVIYALVYLAAVKHRAVFCQQSSRTVKNTAVAHSTVGDDLALFVVQNALSLYLAHYEFTVVIQMIFFVKFTAAVIFSVSELALIYQ